MQPDHTQTLITFLKARLQSAGKTKSIDQNGNVTYIDADIYSDPCLKSFINLAVSDFNQCPEFTNFHLDDKTFVETFSEVLVVGATLYALSSQALIESGREYDYADEGITFINSHKISDALNNQYFSLLHFHWAKLKTIKSAIKTYGGYSA